MKSALRGLLCFLTIVFLAPGVWPRGELTDPYEILDRYFSAAGGLERLKAEKTTYFEGELSVGGLTGSIKFWSEPPHRSRAEVDLGIIKMTQGDNGKFTWVLK
jgi:hypothetical protein